MDPRPYHFEFRKPRFSNPTYQSVNLYSSIYQPFHQKSGSITPRNPQSHRYKNTEAITKPSSQPDNNSIKRNQSAQFTNKLNKIQLPRYPSKQQLYQSKMQPNKTKQRSYSLVMSTNAYPQNNSSKLSNYGYNLMQNHQQSGGICEKRVDQKQVFDKQQNSFNIITYHPTQYRARLKMFPKLTLEDKIFQKRTGSPAKIQ